MIELYTAPMCSGCQHVKTVLDAENIPYKEIDITTLSLRDQGDVLTDLRVSYPGAAPSGVLEAPIARNPTTGDAIPASVLCDGRDIVKAVSEILD
ncbi:MAG: glutaredoxin domain-containing protein [Aliarcobacter sp.]|nr:glutaredoxin domain-containing protein [Euryarchaeota archaeon]